MTMTNDEKRIAIAEKCGWKRHENHPGLFFHESGKIQPKIAAGERLHLERLKKNLPCRYGIELLPNYIEDLNACHEMEKTLTDSQWVGYLNNLGGGFKTEFRQSVSYCHATAAQRCDAFLLTHGFKL